MKKSTTPSIRYPQNRLIAKQLWHGARPLIQQKTGLSYSVIKLTLLGYRNNQQVLETAKKLIEKKSQFIAE